MLRKHLIMLLFGMTFLLTACSASGDTAAVEVARDLTQAETTLEQLPMTIQEDTFLRSAQDPGQEVEAAEYKDPEAPDTMNYFTFVQESTDYTDETGRKLLIEQLTYAEYTSADEEQSLWVNSFLEQNYYQDAGFSQDLLNFAQSNLKELGEKDFYTHSHYVTMGAGRHDETLISILHVSSAYSGGVHPNSVQTSFNLDLEGKRLLRLEDVIYEGADDALIRRVREAIESKFSALGEGYLYENYADTITTALTYGNMTPYWYFNDEGLVVYFNQYELGPYASGIISAHLSYEDLDSIIKPQYMPIEMEGEVKNVTVSETLTEGVSYYDVNLGEGSTLYITVEGEAYHVRFSEVYWVESTPVGQSVMFSAAHIEDGAVIAVTSEAMDPERIYAIEYCDKTGSYLIYLKNGETYTELPVE